MHGEPRLPRVLRAASPVRPTMCATAPIPVERSHPAVFGGRSGQTVAVLANIRHRRIPPAVRLVPLQRSE